jgi:hypothetical protein
VVGFIAGTVAGVVTSLVLPVPCKFKFKFKFYVHPFDLVHLRK